MTPDDPRHGTATGYRRGCRDACCRRAAADKAADYYRRSYLEGGPLKVPGTGTARRLRALIALGWSGVQIADELGLHFTWINKRIAHPEQHVFLTTHRRVDAVYRRMSMRVPPDTPYTRRSRARAQRLGWAPPLAWDDDTIDDPDAEPQGIRQPRLRPSLDSGEIAELVYFGGTYQTIGERLGCSKDGIFRRLRADGRHDLLRVLAQRGAEGQAAATSERLKGRRRAA